MSLIGGLGVSLWAADQARVQRDLAQAEARKSRAVADFMIDVFGAADPAMVDGADLTPRDLLVQGARRLGEDNDLDTSTRSALRLAIGSAQLGISEYEPGLEQMQAAVTEAVAAGDALVELEARLGLGVALNKLQRSEEAIAQYDLARAIGKRLPDLAAKTDEEIDYFRAIELGRLDRKAESVQVLKTVYGRRLARLGPGEPLTIQVATTLAYYLGNLKRADEGILITEPSYQAARARAGLPLRWLKDIVSAHAYMLLLDKRPEASSLFEEARSIDERVYGKGHPGTVVTMNNVAFAMSSGGDHARAAAIIEEVITIRRGMKLEQNQDLAFSLINAANMWRKAGKFERAIERAREGIAIYVARNDGFYRQAQKGRWSLALALEATGQWQEALREMSELLPYTEDGRSTEFSGPDAALPWLTAARIEARLHAVDPGCLKARRVLTIDAAEETATEARILLAMCQARHGDDLASHDTLPVLASDDALLAKIDPFVRDWYVTQKR
ncbi:MAG: tetratricopeptide repeat protein [Ahniella sp.]|nr:tetratricopeptide repeat protein [Ahniella sp.]